jgi:hypothetical protein
LSSIWLLAATLAAAEAAAQPFGLHVPARNESLRLVRHDVQLDVRHPVVETMLTQEFENPHPFNLEAFFHYPVPAGATVTGLALWVNGVRREARMLERQKAREIYEGIVREKRDPALVERTDGGFRIRIFPVLARSRQRVELRFVQPVEQVGEGAYRVTLRKPPGSTVHALRLGVRLQSGAPIARAELSGYGARALEREESGVHVLSMPTAPRSFRQAITLRYWTGPGPAVAAHTLEDGERLFVAEIPLARGDETPRRLALLLDTSSSIEPHLEAVRSFGRALLAHLLSPDELALVPFGLLPRATVSLTFVGSGRRRIEDRLDGLTCRGGTAFVPAVMQAVRAGARHLVLVTDGGTAAHQAELEHLLKLLYDRRTVTVSVVLVGRGQNEEALTDLARVTGGAFERLGAASERGELARRLATRRLRTVPRLACPRCSLHVLRAAGGGMLVAGAAPASARSVVVELDRPGRRETLDLGRSTGFRAVQGLFGAAAVAARMREIKLLGETEARRRAVVALSKRHNVMSEYTALLATETDADYLRPTSGRKWQRRTPGADLGDLPPTSFNSTPEPHEWALIGLGLVILLLVRRRGWSRA